MPINCTLVNQNEAKPQHMQQFKRERGVQIPTTKLTSLINSPLERIYKIILKQQGHYYILIILGVLALLLAFIIYSNVMDHY